jgi:hypothetical protein
MLSRGCGSIASCPWAVACWLDNPSSPAVKQALMNLTLSILVLRALPAENMSATLPEPDVDITHVG